VDAWDQQIEAGGLDAIISTVSGCGSILKQYGRLLAGDKQYAERAKRVSSLVKDVSEWLHETGPPPLTPKNLRVAYQSACSLQQRGWRVGVAEDAISVSNPSGVAVV
jgi:glycolate oxidase iron-sulfur subunit